MGVNLEELRPPTWHKMTKENEPEDGAVYILAFYVHNNKSGLHHWQIEKLQVIAYEDGITLYYCGDEAFSDWEFHDAEFYHKCKD